MNLPPYLLVLLLLPTVANGNPAITPLVPMAASVVDFGIKLYQADPEGRLKQALGKFLFFCSRIFALLGSMTGNMNALLATEKEDENKERFSVLSGKVQKMNNDMNNRFNDLQAFLSNLNFANNVRIPIENRTIDVINIIANPKGSEQIKRFLNDKKVSLRNLRNFYLNVHNQATNPIAVQMKGDKDRSKKTMDQILAKMDALVDQALFNDAFEYGLRTNQSEMLLELQTVRDRNTAMDIILKSSYFNNSGEVWEQAVQVKTELTDNADKFKSKNDVWPELVRRLVEDAIDKHANADRHYKADKIQTVLDDLYTTERYFIIAKENCTVNCSIAVRQIQVHEKHEEPTHMEIMWNNTSILVYRSVTAYRVSKRDNARMSAFFAHRRMGEIEFQNYYDPATADSTGVAHDKPFDWQGMVLIIEITSFFFSKAVIGHAEAWMLLRKEMRAIAALHGCGMVHVAWTGNLERGPGWWLRGPNYHFIVGFP